jgi:hypothetical protein
MSLASLMFRSLGGLISPPRNTQTAATIIASPIVPFYDKALMASGVKVQGITHITTVCYTTGSTAHDVYICRPFNYTYFSAAAAASQAVVNIAADPGNYTSNWNYPPFPGTPSTANNLIAGGDYVMYQRADGTWCLDTVASVSTLAITLTTNLLTGGVLQGGLFYWFGIPTDTDPNTGQGQPNTLIAASQVRDKTWSDTTCGVVASLHDGDPMFFYSANPTVAGALEFLAGFYSKL